MLTDARRVDVGQAKRRGTLDQRIQQAKDRDKINSSLVAAMRLRHIVLELDDGWLVDGHFYRSLEEAWEAVKGKLADKVEEREGVV